MNYEMEVSRSLPWVFNSLDGTSPPLVAGSGSATKFSSTQSLYGNFPLFKVGTETVPFSLEVWWLPVTTATNELLGVIGHGGEGVMWDGKKFILRILNDGQNVDASWTPSTIGTFHIVLTYTVGAASLYVNGEMVASVELIGTVFAGQYDWNILLNAGASVGLYDSLALYPRALTSSEVKEHYDWGNSVPDATAIAMAKGATTWSLSYENVDILETFVFANDSFAEGYVESVGVEDGLLRAGSAEGGIWRQSVVLTEGTTAGVHIAYVGEGITFSYSLDGITWTPSPNETTIIEDVVLPSPLLFIQFELADDASWLRSLRVDALASRTMNPLSGRKTLTFKSAAMDETPGNQLDYQSDWGADLNNGYLRVARSQEADPELVGTVEMWIKINSNRAGWNTIVDTDLANTDYAAWIGFDAAFQKSGTVYVNGVLKSDSQLLPVGVWTHIVLVEDTPANVAAYIGASRNEADFADMTVGHLALYPQKMSAAQASGLYSYNIGAPALRVNDPGGVTVTESSPAGKILAYNWSYVSGGS